ncbi:MAG: ABC transporter permease subunit [Peptococcaceae bacterium]|nr:ABC transporter permease subunit [Peptococcaceae bacterium]
MRQLAIFAAKEWRGLWKTQRGLVLTLVFCVMGILSPAIAKMMPWLLESLAGDLAASGIAVGEIQVDAFSAWTQYFKNMPMMLIVYVLMMAGSLPQERSEGTLVMLLAKGLRRSSVVLGKAVILIIAWSLGNLLSAALTYGYSAYYWDNGICHHLIMGVALFWLFGIWVISLMTLAGTCIKSSGSILILTGVGALASYLLGFLDKLSDVVPTKLLESMALLTGATSPGDYTTSIVVTALLSVVNILLALVIFRRAAV